MVQGNFNKVGAKFLVKKLFKQNNKDKYIQIPKLWIVNMANYIF